MFEHIVGVSVETQELGYLSPKIDDALANRQIVLRVVVDAFGVACHVHFFAQFTLCGICHKRRETGEIECEHPSFQTFLLGGECRRFARRFGQSVEVVLVGYVQLIGLVLLEQVLRELQREHPSLFGELSQTLLTLIVEQRSASDEAVIAVFEQHRLLGSERAVVLIYIFDALKQFPVQPHIVGVFGENGT